tara:strand:- start:1269 stop:1592 length:324 start_codon:yes stop_codon:yes gene_type:complete
MENSENSKSMGSTFMTNLLMFVVLVLITFVPPALFLADYFKAIMTLDIARAFRVLENVTFMLPLILIILNGAFAYVCLTMERFKTDMTKYWAYVAIADCVWWLYCMF